MMKFIKTTILAILFVALASFTNTLDAQTAKFAHFNSVELVAGLDEMKRAESTLKTFEQQKMNYYQSKKKAFEDKYMDAMAKGQAGTLSPADEERISKELEQMQKDLIKLEQTITREIAEKRKEEIQPILDRVYAAVEAVASDNGYTYIFDTSVGTLLYAKESKDISAQILAKL